MTTPGFNDCVLLEQIRRLEEAGDARAAIADVDSSRINTPDTPFLDNAIRRARHIAASGELGDALARPRRLHRLGLVVAAAITALLGLAATGNALSSASGATNAINIYWLLLVLLGFNWLSLSLWLAGCVLASGALIGGVWGKLAELVPAVAGRRRDGMTGAWFDCHYRGSIGTWRLSAHTHLLWLSYLGAGLAALVVLLSVEQYQFYWGSTLLSAEQFGRFTGWLAAPLSALGLAVPSQDLLSGSRLGNNGAAPMADAVRRQWAQFLMAALLCYGLLPRALGWFTAQLLLQRAQRRFRPDLYLPYYVTLRHRLQPDRSAGVVVDADAGLPHRDSTAAPSRASAPLPDDAVTVGLELPDAIAVGAAANVAGQSDLAAARRLLAKRPQSPVAVVVQSHTLPDRGLQRQANELFQDCPERRRWLLILDDAGTLTGGFTGTETAPEPAAAQDNQRLAAWYTLARQAGVPADQVQVSDSGQWPIPQGDDR